MPTSWPLSFDHSDVYPKTLSPWLAALGGQFSLPLSNGDVLGTTIVVSPCTITWNWGSCSYRAIKPLRELLAFHGGQTAYEWHGISRGIQKTGFRNLYNTSIGRCLRHLSSFGMIDRRAPTLPRSATSSREQSIHATLATMLVAPSWGKVFGVKEIETNAAGWFEIKCG